jgi:hypothetical protein
MNHRNEQVGFDQQGRLKTKRKRDHRHGNNHAAKRPVAKAKTPAASA